jgi:hypothetical protein
MTNKSEWLPWTELPKRSNITPYELIDWLRYRAIEFGAPPLFIDAIEGLGSAELSETATAEIQELEKQLTAATDQRDAFESALKEVVAELIGQWTAKSVQEALDIASDILKEFD